jgi:alkanesulfonate monooxygenase SsuD/methylene tetrahydromethanopterin reductase-like flavin-dependent oxidoreductase (luciferase family)
MADRQMHLGLMLTATGAHFGAWRLPESTPQTSFTLDHYARIAEVAERGLLDFVFMADSLGLYPMGCPCHSCPIRTGTRIFSN